MFVYLWLIESLQYIDILINFSNVLEYHCEYTEGIGNGIKRIKMIGGLDLQRCANLCFQMRLDGNEAINGATLDKKTCYCEKNQTLTWYSKQKRNCLFKQSIQGEFLFLV